LLTLPIFTFTIGGCGSKTLAGKIVAGTRTHIGRLTNLSTFTFFGNQESPKLTGPDSARKSGWSGARAPFGISALCAATTTTKQNSPLSCPGERFVYLPIL